MLAFVMCTGQRGHSGWGVMGLTLLLARSELTLPLPAQRGGPLDEKMERSWESLPAQANAMLSLEGNELEGSRRLVQSSVYVLCDLARCLVFAYCRVWLQWTVNLTLDPSHCTPSW